MNKETTLTDNVVAFPTPLARENVFVTNETDTTMASERNVLRLVFPSIDPEADYFLDKLQLKIEDGQTLRAVINQLGENAYELPGLIIAVSMAIRNHVDPEYWRPNFERYWADILAQYDSFHEDMRAQGKSHSTITKEDAEARQYCSNLKWMSQTREEVLEFIDTERRRAAAVRNQEKIVDFLKWAEMQLQPDLWKKLLTFFHIEEIQGNTIRYNTTDVEQLRSEWQSFERIGKYLSPRIREFIGNNPYFDPEFAADIPDSYVSKKAGVLRAQVVTRQIIHQPNCPDDIFKSLTTELFVLMKDELLAQGGKDQLLLTRVNDTIKLAAKSEKLTKKERKRILLMLGVHD